MLTKVSVDDHLLQDAQQAGGHRTKRETVTAALQEYVRRLKQQQVLALFGKIDYDPRYNYGRERKRS